MTGLPGHFGPAASRAPRGQWQGRSWASIAFLLLWIGMLWALPNRGGGGIAFVVGASVLATLALPLEYAAVAAAAPTLLPTLFGGLPPWYMGTFRWPFLFVLSAILIVRCLSVRTSQRGGVWSFFVAALSAFVVVSALSAINAVSPSLSLSKLCILLCAIFSAGACGTKIVQMHGGKAARRWARAWLVCLSPVLVVNIVSALTGVGGEIYVQDAFRGLSGNSNALASVVAMVLPFFVCPFIYRRRTFDARSGLLVALALGSGYLLVLTWSRASIAAFSGGLLILWWIHPRNRLTRYMAAAGAVVVFFTVSSPYVGDHFEYWLYKGQEQDTLLSARTEQWRHGIEAFKANPILGAGFGITSSREEAWSLDSFERLKEEQGSSFFAILGQTGLLGVVPFYAAMVISLFTSTRFAAAVKDPWLTAVVSSCWVAFFNSFFEGWMAAPSSGLFWFLMFQAFFLNAITNQLLMPRCAVFRSGAGFAGPSPRFASLAPRSALRGTQAS